MAFEKFNSVGGYNVGIPPIQVIDEYGNLVSNVKTTGSVTANMFYFGNGVPLTQSAAGSNTQVQYNSNGVFSASPTFTFDSASYTLNVINFSASGGVVLSDVSNLKIYGGTDGYFLQTDGTGNLTWSLASGGGNGSPGGSNTQIQFNDNGSFSGVNTFNFNKTSNTLSVPNIVASQVTGNLSGNGYNITTIQANNIVGIIPLTQQVSDNNQPNITNVGTLTNLSISGDLNSTGNISLNGNLTVGNINVSKTLAVSNSIVTGNSSVGGAFTTNSLRVIGSANLALAPNIFLGQVANVHISGGTNGYVLSTDGTGNLNWVPQTGGNGGGNGSPAGIDTQVQFNNNGSFGASPYLTYDENTHTLEVAGNLVANTVQVGAGAFNFSSSQVYFASTSSTIKQTLFSIPTQDISGAEYHIIATDSSASSRQSAKITAVYYNNQVQFNEYAGLYINGGVGTFEVDYNPGDILNPPSMDLKVTPDTNNPVTYKMLITTFAQ